MSQDADGLIKQLSASGPLPRFQEFHSQIAIDFSEMEFLFHSLKDPQGEERPLRRLKTAAGLLMKAVR